MTASYETTLTVNEEDEKEVVAANLGDKSGETVKDSNEEAEDSTNEVNKLEQWNHPRINMYRYLTTLFCLILMGMNDAAYGVSLSKTISKEKLTFYQGFDSICKRHIPHAGAFAWVSSPIYKPFSFCTYHFVHQTHTFIFHHSRLLPSLHCHFCLVLSY